MICTRTDYCYGYYISNDKFHALPAEIQMKLEKSHWFDFVNTMAGECDGFYGLDLYTIEEGETFEIPLNYPFMQSEFIEMITDYRTIFGQKPGIAHYYIINFIY